MLTGELHFEHLALAVIDDLISRFNLIQERLNLGERLTAGCVLRIGANDTSGSEKFVCKFASKEVVIFGRLGDNFGIWLSSVQGAEPTFKRQTPSKPKLMQPCHGLGERHIEICNDGEILCRAGYLVQQKTGKPNCEQQKDYGESENLCCYGLLERHMSSQESPACPREASRSRCATKGFPSLHVREQPRNSFSSTSKTPKLLTHSADVAKWQTQRT